jgi:hypothetical protein
MKILAASAAVQADPIWHALGRNPLVVVVALLIALLIIRMRRRRKGDSAVSSSGIGTLRDESRGFRNWSATGKAANPAVGETHPLDAGFALTGISEGQAPESPLTPTTDGPDFTIEQPDPWSSHTPGAMETTLINAANTVISSGTPDRQRVRRTVRDQYPGIRLYSPARTSNTAEVVYRQYWFEEDARGATWLGAPTPEGSGLTVVPIEFRDYGRDALMTYLGTLFDGVANAEEAVRSGDVAITAAARLTRLPDGSYQVTSRGRLQPRRGAVSAPAQDVVQNGPKRQSEKLEQRMQQLESRQQELSEQVRRTAAARDVVGRRGDPQLDHRMGELEDRIGRIEVLNEQMQATLRAVERSLRTDSPQTSTAAESRRTSDQSPTKNVFGRNADLPDTSLPATPKPLRLPSDWSDRLVHGAIENADFGNSQIYATAVQAAVEVFSRNRGRGDAAVAALHLLAIVPDDNKIYKVHPNDLFADTSGAIVLQCVERPGAMTPADQFFICFTDGSDAPAQISVVCPVGIYSPRFDFGALLDRVPDGVFRVSGVIAPAELVALRDGNYRVAQPMQIAIDW